MTTAKKKPLKKVPARDQKKPQASRRVAPAKPRYSEQYKQALKSYERGIALLQKKNFGEAIEVFRELAEQYQEEGEICDRARQYTSICQERLGAKGPRPSGAADHFPRDVVSGPIVDRVMWRVGARSRSRRSPAWRSDRPVPRQSDGRWCRRCRHSSAWLARPNRTR